MFFTLLYPLLHRWDLLWSTDTRKLCISCPCLTMKYIILIGNRNFIILGIKRFLRKFILIRSVWGGEIGYTVLCNLETMWPSHLSVEGLWPQSLQSRSRRIWVQMKSYLNGQTNRNNQLITQSKQQLFAFPVFSFLFCFWNNFKISEPALLFRTPSSAYIFQSVFSTVNQYNN